MNNWYIFMVELMLLWDRFRIYSSSSWFHVAIKMHPILMHKFQLLIIFPLSRHLQYFSLKLPIAYMSLAYVCVMIVIQEINCCSCTYDNKTDEKDVILYPTRFFFIGLFSSCYSVFSVVLCVLFNCFLVDLWGFLLVW